VIGSFSFQMNVVYFTPHIPWRVLVEMFGGGVPPASPNPDPISDQKMLFPTPLFRPGHKNPYPFSDLTRRPLA